ncbi:porin [Algoriphagus vanfongensis]|uniref:porin n=1 Tax=Algoriphagus vanfongensis TaxID=426371 RepID=UPI000401DA21|nr:porin [Algoriphagus vanfongensis]
MLRPQLVLFLFFIWLAPTFSALAQSEDSTQASITHSSKGFVFTTADKKFQLQFASRLQFRFATPDDQNPLTFDDFDNPDTRLFKINRARLKIGGHAYQPWLKYYFEYELAQGNLLDFRVMIEKWPWLKFKFGQWKVEYTRERFISSGEQQLVDRSIINRPFTLDRQQGATVYGNLAGKGIANFSYWVAALTGTGRGSTFNDDNKLMYFGRLQWNFLGEELDFAGGDLEISQRPVGIIAFAAVTNTSPYTRFSQSGGGQLEGFEAGENGQYKVDQFQVESALNYQGFSWAMEIHRKTIFDIKSQNGTTLGGFYAQAGYFPHGLIPSITPKLEIAMRLSQYRPDLDIRSNTQQEVGLVGNYFFAGHKNKLTAEVTRFTFEDQSLLRKDETRFRFQWDISF